MSTRTDLREFIELEDLLARHIQWISAEKLAGTWVQVSSEIEKENYDLAVNIAENLSFAYVGDKMDAYAYTVFRSMIDFGARLATRGRALTSSLVLDKVVNAQIRQLKTYLTYGYSIAAQDELLQLIAQAKAEKDTVVRKAAAIRQHIPFIDKSNSRAQMVSGLHTSRLGGWGFVAESEMIGTTTYKLSAQLDNRTSNFCKFIHGKTFTVESAKVLLDQAVYLDDPEALRSVHPWPNQSKAGLEQITSMSQADLQARGYGVPPFHPGCRTLMVAIDYTTRLVAPPARVQDIPAQVSTKDSFEMLSIPISPNGLSVWNDYVGLNPAEVISTLTNTPIKDLLSKAPKMIKVTNSGDVVMGLGKSGDLLRLITGTGELKARGATAFDFLFAKKGLSNVKSFANSVSASSLELEIPTGGAYRALLEGFVPVESVWNSVKGRLLKAMSTLALSESEISAVKRVLSSPNPMSFGKLATELPEAPLKKLMSDVSFRGVLSFDATGLS